MVWVAHCNKLTNTQIDIQTYKLISFIYIDSKPHVSQTNCRKGQSELPEKSELPERFYSNILHVCYP